MTTRDSNFSYLIYPVKTDDHKNAHRSGIQPRLVKGFSLVELVVVMAIMGIIATIAIPSYQQFITKERRADAHNLLMSNAARLTKCFTLAGSYENDCNLVSTSKSGFYSLSSELTATTWKITALPISDNAQSKDSGCQTMAIDHIGIKTATGDNVNSCWD